jgi:hypothetical protein
VTAENINSSIAENGFQEEIDLLSVDIDGYDFWIWRAITHVRPHVEIIETHVEFGERNSVVPYDPDYRYPGIHPQYHGASPVAMIELGREKGYRLIGINPYGLNFIFLGEDEGQESLPPVALAEAIQHPRNRERAA